jgi:hypothetical protein
MTQLDGMTFRNQDIRLDGVAYRNCRFEGCRIVFGGHLATALEGNQFTNCTWAFDGPAGLTLQFMAAMHAQGGDARVLIDATVRTLRGEPSVAPPAAAPAIEAAQPAALSPSRQANGSPVTAH